MIEIGKYHTLRILRETSVGLYLGDDFGEDVLLPNKYCPEKFELYEPIEVFVYRDNAERKVATNLTPDILLHEFGLLQVKDISHAGAFMDWGLEKHLLVPFSEQRQEMEVGRWYIIYMDIDTKTDRLYGSNKIEQRLQNEELTVAEGDEVDLLVYKETDLGFSVIVNHIHQGLVFQNETFREIRVGDTVKGFVKKIREENKLDISLQPLGYRSFNSMNTELICNALMINDGYLPVTDKSSPEDIYSRFGISKKAFKKAIGALYKERKILIEEEGIKLI
ncbi:MAG TPA: S1-like domain-containing RNA-binding protein [Saprospiraceae bacterium]|nr:S1-like domain-containing RNA-binding protein [Saprospiraceae bacterium]